MGESAPKKSAVLAIGALPGDVEGACAGFLLSAVQRGDDVLVLPLSTGSVQDGEGAQAERRGAELLGARIIITAASVSHAENPEEHQLLLERIVREIKPHTALIPSLADSNVERREAHRIAKVAVADVATVLAYETATASAQFHPDRFVDIAPHIEKKLEVLTAYRGHGRPDLEYGYVEAAARHWGRLLDFGMAEAFEVLWGPDQSK